MTEQPGDLSINTPTSIDAIAVSVDENRDIVNVIVQERAPVAVTVSPAGTQGPAGTAGPAGDAGPRGLTGIPGPPGGGGTFVHSQLAAAAVWTIVHDLGRFPPVFTIDSAGTEVIGDVGYPDDNTVTVTFFNPQGGTAYLAE